MVPVGRHRGFLRSRGGYRPLFFGLGSGRVLDLRARVGSGLKVRIRVGPKGSDSSRACIFRVSGLTSKTGAFFKVLLQFYYLKKFSFVKKGD